MSAYWASLSLSRVVFGALATRHRPERLLRVSLALSSGASALIWWAAQPVIGLLGLTALGVAFAPIYPLLVAITPERRSPPRDAGGGPAGGRRLSRHRSLPCAPARWPPRWDSR